MHNDERVMHVRPSLPSMAHFFGTGTRAGGGTWNLYDSFFSAVHPNAESDKFLKVKISSNGKTGLEFRVFFPRGSSAKEARGTAHRLHSTAVL